MPTKPKVEGTFGYSMSKTIRNLFRVTFTYDFYIAF